MNVKKTLVRIANQVTARVCSWLNGNGWEWIGDDQHPALFEKKADHGDLRVVLRLAIDEETSRQDRFSDVWVPGAVLIPSCWKDRVDQDIQWWVPQRQLHFGFQAANAVGNRPGSLKQLFEHIETDIRIVAGERPLYRIDVEVYYRSECVVIKSAPGLVINIDENLLEADEIAAPLVSEAANEARKTWTYRSMAFSAA